MGTLSYPFTLVAGQPENVNQLNSNLAAVATVVNGGIDATNITNGTVGGDELHTALAGRLGVSQTAVPRRGVTIISTEEARSNAAYGTLTTPDVVTGIVLPSAGLIFVAYQAMMKNSVLSAGRAAIFLGSNQVKVAQNNTAAPVVAEESGGNSATDTYRPLTSCLTNGLTLTSSATAYTGDVTTGQLLGESGTVDGNNFPGVAIIFAAAGTYDVSVQFKSATGSVTVKNRNLWVWTMGF